MSSDSINTVIAVVVLVLAAIVILDAAGFGLLKLMEGKINNMERKEGGENQAERGEYHEDK